MILGCGEVLVDLFVLGEKGARLAAEAVAGGSPERIACLDLETLGSVLSYAITASSITCRRRGADLPTARDVEAVSVGAAAH